MIADRHPVGHPRASPYPHVPPNDNAFRPHGLRGDGSLRCDPVLKRKQPRLGADPSALPDPNAARAAIHDNAHVEADTAASVERPVTYAAPGIPPRACSPRSNLELALAACCSG